MRNLLPTTLTRSLLWALVAGSTFVPAFGQTSTERVANGGFESSTLVWAGTTGVIGNWTSQGQPAYEGAKAAWLGGNGKTTTETLYQTVTIPSTETSATLSFYLHIDTKETGTTVYDKLAVQVRNASGTVLGTLATYSNVQGASGYQLRTFNLSAYKGQTIRIHFNMTEDASLATNFLVDKVSLLTSGGSPTIPAVPTGLTATASGSTALTVTWNAVSNATGYDLQVDGVVKANVTSPYSHTGLAAGSTHTYRVLAKNTAGSSAWSAQVSGTTNPAGNKTLYTTCVQDDLDPADRTYFVNAMKPNGYTELGSNTNVSSSALKTLLERSDITLLYHTGHGFDGSIATAGGSLSVNSLSTIRNTHFIAATCLTMVPTTWKSKMSATSQTVMGYTNYSWDITDNTVATKFGTAIGQGQSYPKAWYTCNLPYSNLVDRWCVYAREASGVVEYSARTGNIPARAAGNTLLVASSPSTQVFMAEGLKQAPVPTQAFEAVPHHAFDRAKVEAREDFQDFLGEGQGFAAFAATPVLTEDQARILAEGWMRTHLPLQDAKVDKVIAVQTVREDITQVNGHMVRFVKVVGDLPVRSNGEDDHVVVFVKGGKVTGYTQAWSPSRPATTQPGRPTLLSPAAALAKASQDILRRLKGSVTLVAAKPCLTRSGSMTVPAYELVDDRGGSLIVDAVTGRMY